MSGIGRVKILGLGLVGGSLARLLVDRDVTVTGWDTDSSTRAAAGAAGIRTSPDYASFLNEASDLILVATPIDVIPQALEDIAGAADCDSVVSDVGSVKVATEEWALAAGLSRRYVGLHPMAGIAASGLAASDPEIYVGIPWIVLPNASALERTCDVIAFLCSQTQARVLVTDAASHDASAALVSHVPHAIANALLCEVSESATPGLAFSMAAGSFRDMTRVAGIDPRRTENMLLWNREAVAQGLLDLADRLVGLSSQLRAGSDALPFLTQAQHARDAMDEPAASGSQLVTREQAISSFVALGVRGASITRLEREGAGYRVDIS